MRLSPSSTLSTIAALYLGTLIVTIVIGTNERVTGLSWNSEGGQVVVSGHPDLAKPEAVQALVSGGQRFELSVIDVLPEPDVLPRFAQTHEFFQRQDRLTGLLKNDEIVLFMADGSQFAVPVRDKTLADFSVSYWMIHLAGLLGLLITGGVWSYKPGMISARIFLLSGFGFALLTMALAFYSTRELALAEPIFRVAHALNRLGMILLTFGGSALMWHYPTQLGRFPFGRLILGIGLLFWFNETFQWLDTPFHSYFDSFLICTVASVVNGAFQWRRSTNQPLERAALRWLLLSFLISFTAIWLLYVIPILVTHSLQINLVVATWIVLCVFLGIAVGVSRYRIFDLDRWWLRVWLWFINGLMIFIIDVALIALLDIGFISSLTLTILIVGWLYFPIRQLALKRLMGRQARPLKDLLPQILGFMLKPHSREQSETFWQQLLRQACRPMQIEPLEKHIRQVAVQDDGMVLQVPDIGGRAGWELAGCEGGRRLFNKTDVQLLQQCFELVCFGEAQYREREDATSRERERIMRDLHDDVGAKLLTLIHRVPDTYSDMARSALATLRETIFSLNVDNEQPLNDFMASMREEYVDRTEAAGCELIWRVPDFDDLTVPAHVQINLSRVIRECLTNSLKHSQPSRLWCEATLDDDGQLTIILTHDGDSVPVAQWGAGNGVLNTQRRMKELAGVISFKDRFPQGIVTTLSFPVAMNRG